MDKNHGQMPVVGKIEELGRIGPPMKGTWAADLEALKAKAEAAGGEVRVVDSKTGGEKGQKLARFDLFPPEWEWELAEHYGRGSRKYADRNWERGYAWSLSYGALRRHLSVWLQGERRDPETGTHHLIAVIWHAIALYTFELRGLGTDDIRPKKAA